MKYQLPVNKINSINFNHDQLLEKKSHKILNNLEVSVTKFKKELCYNFSLLGL